MTDPDGTGQGEDPRHVSSPSSTQDALSRLWKTTDSSYGHHLEALEEMRERSAESRNRRDPSVHNSTTTEVGPPI